MQTKSAMGERGGGEREDMACHGVSIGDCVCCWCQKYLFGVSIVLCVVVVFFLSLYLSEFPKSLSFFWSTQLTSAKWFVCFFVFKIYIVCGFEERNSLENLRILSLFVWSKSVLFNPLCVFDLFSEHRAVNSVSDSRIMVLTIWK